MDRQGYCAITDFHEHGNAPPSRQGIYWQLQESKTGCGHMSISNRFELPQAEMLISTCCCNVGCSHRFRKIKWSSPPKTGSTILAEVNYDVNVNLEQLARPTEFIIQGKPASKWVKAMWTYFRTSFNCERTQEPASQWCL